MTQVIQGNNLRCLFAEAPPSTTHSKATMYNNGSYPGNAYNITNPRQSMYSDRSSMISSGSSGTLYHGSGYSAYHNNNPYQRTSQALGRREVIMVSDDRVMAVQLAQHSISDSPSYSTQ